MANFPKVAPKGGVVDLRYKRPPRDFSVADPVWSEFDTPESMQAEIDSWQKYWNNADSYNLASDEATKRKKMEDVFSEPFTTQRDRALEKAKETMTPFSTRLNRLSEIFRQKTRGMNGR